VISTQPTFSAARTYIAPVWKIPQRLESGSHQREFARRWRITMTNLRAISTTSALAQEPAAFAAQYPDRDILNGGALTPAGRLGLENPGGAAGLYAANKAAVGIGSANASIQPLATGSPRHHGRRHSSR
jgi:hypothetical protein